MRRWLVVVLGAALVLAVAGGAWYLSRLEVWAERQPGVERVHRQENDEVRQLEVWVDDVSAARGFHDALRERLGGEHFVAFISWNEGDAERTVTVKPGMPEEVWRLAASALPNGVTAQRIGGSYSGSDPTYSTEVAYISQSLPEGLPTTWFRTSVSVGVATFSAASAGDLDEALAGLGGADVGDLASEESVVDYASRLEPFPRIHVEGSRLAIRRDEQFEALEPLLRDVARGAGRMAADGTVVVELPVEECGLSPSTLTDEQQVEWSCGDVLRVEGRGDLVAAELPALVALSDAGAESVHRVIGDEHGELYVELPEGFDDVDELVQAVRSIGWEGGATVSFGDERFESTATGEAQDAQPGTFVDAWNATATS